MTTEEIQAAVAEIIEMRAALFGKLIALFGKLPEAPSDAAQFLCFSDSDLTANLIAKAMVRARADVALAKLDDDDIAAIKAVL